MTTSIKKPLALISALLLAIFVAAPVLAVAPAPGAFERTWARTDKPVADDVIDRTWIWGPEANTGVMQEPYLESPGGMRDVQYFDKSRMEINHPDAVDDGLWYVTNGLLVVELMTGMMQVGDFSFEERSPADINIVGDPGFPETPTYADYADLRDLPAFAAGSVITATVDGDGNIGNDNDLGQWNVTASELAPLTGHRTASVFWEFMNSSGIVYEDGDFTTDELFLNPYYATGYPITEAYWSLVMLAGSEQWVLTQAFERRVLTYAPNNNPGFQVEAGNVGMHYFQWRYETPETATINVTTFEFDGTTVQGNVLVEAYLLDEGQTCADVDFGTDEPTASGTTNASGAFTFTGLEAGVYCVGADFDGDGVADDHTAVVTVAAGASVAVSLINPDDGVTAELTVTVIGDDDIVVGGTTVELFAGACADLAGDATPLATEVTTGSGVVVFNVDDLDDGVYCLVASDVGGEIGQIEITLPDDTDVTIGGMIGVTVTSAVAANEVQVLSASGATSGTFTLTFDDQTTLVALPFDASAEDIEAALESLNNIGVGDVEVTGGPIHMNDVTVTFTDNLGFQDVPQLVVDSSDLDDVTLSITTTTTSEAGVNEVQTLTPDGVTGGTFALSFNGNPTGDIDYTADAATIQAALEGLPGISAGDVDVGGGPINTTAVTIEFTGNLAATNVSPIMVDNSDLTGTITRTTTTQGVPGVNEVLTIAATSAVAGTFTLTYDGDETAAIPFDATAAQIEAALVAATDIASGDVVVSGGPVHTADVTIEFTGVFAATDVELITGDDSLLLGAEIVVTTTIQGSSPVTQVVYVGSAVTGGSFTLTYEGQTTAAIAFDATAAQLEAALEALPNISNVTVVGDLGAGASSTITFINPSPPASLLVVDDALIT